MTNFLPNLSLLVSYFTAGWDFTLCISFINIITISDVLMTSFSFPLLESDWSLWDFLQFSQGLYIGLHFVSRPILCSVFFKAFFGHFFGFIFTLNPYFILSQNFISWCSYWTPLLLSFYTFNHSTDFLSFTMHAVLHRQLFNCLSKTQHIFTALCNSAKQRLKNQINSQEIQNANSEHPGCTGSVIFPWKNIKCAVETAEKICMYKTCSIVKTCLPSTIIYEPL